MTGVQTCALPICGTVEFEGRRINGLAPRDIWRLGVGRTFQITATFQSMTVIENVQMALISADGRLFSLWRRAAHHKADEAMDLKKPEVTTGTGDLAIAYWKKGGGKIPVIGTDFTPEMLRRAGPKVSGGDARAVFDWLSLEMISTL